MSERFCEPADGYVEVLTGIHAGVERIGRKVVNHINARSIWGVHTTDIHPEAERAGVRSFGSKELGQWFTDETLDKFEDLNPEELAVHGYVYDLNRPCCWLTIDPHCAPAYGADALVIGDRSDPMLLGLAHCFELKNVIVISGYPMFDMFPQTAAIETEDTDRPTSLSQPEFWQAKLEEIVKLGPDQLREIAIQTRKELAYYRLTHLERVSSKTGQPQDEEMLAMIGELEGYKAEVFEPVELPVDLARHLGLEGMPTYAGSAWDDVNNSRPRPDLFGYRRDGRPRLSTYGDILLRMAAPRILHSDPFMRFPPVREYALS